MSSQTETPTHVMIPVDLVTATMNCLASPGVLVSRPYLETLQLMTALKTAADASFAEQRKDVGTEEKQ